MKIKLQTELPITGRFIAMHIFDGELWSGTYRYNEDGILEDYAITELDDWGVSGVDFDGFQELVGYVVLDTEEETEEEPHGL